MQDHCPDLGLSRVERVTGIEPKITAKDLQQKTDYLSRKESRMRKLIIGAVTAVALLGAPAAAEAATAAPSADAGDRPVGLWES